jgi:hypothetical protein
VLRASRIHAQPHAGVLSLEPLNRRFSGGHVAFWDLTDTADCLEMSADRITTFFYCSAECPLLAQTGHRDCAQ